MSLGYRIEKIHISYCMYILASPPLIEVRAYSYTIIKNNNNDSSINRAKTLPKPKLILHLRALIHHPVNISPRVNTQ